MLVPRCKNLIFFDKKQKGKKARNKHPPGPDHREGESGMCAGLNSVCSGMGGLFRAVFSEPAGPPFVLAELLHYDGLQECDLDGFEAILAFFHLQLFNTKHEQKVILWAIYETYWW